MFGLHWTTSGTHHSVVPALMSGQAAQLDFTQSLPLLAVGLLLSPKSQAFAGVGDYNKTCSMGECERGEV